MFVLRLPLKCNLYILELFALKCILTIAVAFFLAAHKSQIIKELQLLNFMPEIRISIGLLKQ